MNSKNTNFDVKTEAQFYAEKLQSRHLNQVASDACLYVPSKERINKVLFTTREYAVRYAGIVRARAVRRAWAHKTSEIGGHPVVIVWQRPILDRSKAVGRRALGRGPM